MLSRLIFVVISVVYMAQAQASTMTFYNTASDKQDSMLLIAGDGKIYQRLTGTLAFNLFRVQLPAGIKAIEILVRRSATTSAASGDTRGYTCILFAIGSDGEVYLLQEDAKDFVKQAYTFPAAPAADAPVVEATKPAATPKPTPKPAAPPVIRP